MDKKNPKKGKMGMIIGVILVVVVAGAAIYGGTSGWFTGALVKVTTTQKITTPVATNPATQVQTTTTAAQAPASAQLNLTPEQLAKAEADAKVRNDAATAAVEKAEGSKTQTDVDAAQVKVTALPNIALKTELQQRITAVQAIITAANQPAQIWFSYLDKLNQPANPTIGDFFGGLGTDHQIFGNYDSIYDVANATIPANIPELAFQLRNAGGQPAYLTSAVFANGTLNSSNCSSYSIESIWDKCENITFAASDKLYRLYYTNDDKFYAYKVFSDNPTRTTSLATYDHAQNTNDIQDAGRIGPFESAVFVLLVDGNWPNTDPFDNPDKFLFKTFLDTSKMNIVDSNGTKLNFNGEGSVIPQPIIIRE